MVYKEGFALLRIFGMGFTRRCLKLWSDLENDFRYNYIDPRMLDSLVWIF